MSKHQKSDLTKIKNKIQRYPREFKLSIDNKLFCKLCSKLVSYGKEFYIQNHRQSQKHLKSLANDVKIIQNPLQNNILEGNPDIIEVFLSCGIPLFKLRHPILRNYFLKQSIILPSETAARNETHKICNKIKEKIKNQIFNKKICIQIDESQCK